MIQVHPYLLFNGNCEEAINFYASCLNGKVDPLMRFKDAPMPASEEDKERIMHCTLTLSNGSVIQASDSQTSFKVTAGDNFSISLNFDDQREIEEAFKKMSEGGQVTLPLQDTFWGAQFGMMKDKFGVAWMFNRQLKKD